MRRLAWVILFFAVLSPLFAFEWQSFWYPDDNSHELLEEIADYDSVINWSTGKVLTEATLSISYDDANIGRQFSKYTAEINTELKQKMLDALGYLRISDLYLLKDYYNRQSDLRYEIVATAENAFFYPPIIDEDECYGLVQLDLFGEEGLANLFYRDLYKSEQDTYLIEDIDEDTDYFDGLIIDMIACPEFMPSIQMRILDEDGNVLYGPETVVEDKLTELGVCEFTTSLRYAFSSDRVGNQIYYVMPLEVTGMYSNEIVLDNADAARLFSNPLTLSNLNQSQVIIVKPEE